MYTGRMNVATKYCSKEDSVLTSLGISGCRETPKNGFGMGGVWEIERKQSQAKK
jgi:hypothetical protein